MKIFEATESTGQDPRYRRVSNSVCSSSSRGITDQVCKMHRKHNVARWCLLGRVYEGGAFIHAVSLSSPPGHGLGRPQVRPLRACARRARPGRGTCALGFIGAGLWAIPIRFCLCSLGCGRFRHYFWTVVAFILDGVVGCGIGHRCRPVS